MAVQVTEADNGQEVTIHVSGRFDFSAHRDFMGAYKEYAKGEKTFIVDLTGAEYMDSSAMGMLLQLRDHAVSGSDIVLTNANEGVREILRIANFDKLFTIS